MKNFFNLLKRGPSLLGYYIKISGSFDFMIRYIVLGLLYLINAIFLNILEKIINQTHPIFYKLFVFKTPFGTFLGRTVNHRTVLSPDYEPSLRKVIDHNYEKYKNQEKIFIDIGAHIGRYAVELTKNYGYVTYAFEPSPETYKILKSNTILSGIESQAHVFNYALGDRETEMFFDYREDNDASSKIIQESDTTGAGIKVSVKVFDALGLGFNPKKVKLIIMDVEGFEYQVLQGMKKFFQDAGSLDFIIEIMDHQKNRIRTIDFMHSLGYQSKKIDRDNYHFWK